MRKKLIVFGIVLSLIVISVFSLLRSTSSFKSIYFVPEDAIVIFETKDPLKAWEEIIEGKIWNYYKSNSAFSDLNQEIESYDSLVSSNRLLYKIVGEKSLTFSLHPIGNNQFDCLYITDVGKVAQTINHADYLKTLLGKNYQVTNREYEGVTIFEILDKAEYEHYFIALDKGKLLFSYVPQLIEKSILAVSKKIIGNDLKFLEVNARIADKGLMSIYINYKNLEVISPLLSPESVKSLKEYTRFFEYSGLVVSAVEDSLLSMEGYTSLKNNTPEEFVSLLNPLENTAGSSFVVPNRIASFLKFKFEKIDDMLSHSVKSFDSKAYANYEKTLSSIEKKLDIDVSKNVFDWIDHEIVLIQTQPSNLGRDNEFALVLQANDSLKAADNLQILWKQIKSKTPVKIKSVRYQGYNIDYVAFPGLIKALFGGVLEKIEKPYVTQLGKYVVLSNHPQTLKNIIDDYHSQNTLAHSLGYHTFNDLFAPKAALEFYAAPPVLYHNLKGFLTASAWQDVHKNKSYISCFDHLGFQMRSVDGLLKFEMKAHFKPEDKQVKKKVYNSADIYALFKERENQKVVERLDTIPQIIIFNLDGRKHEEFYENGNLKLSVQLKDGLKHGTFKSYYPDEKIKIKGHFKDDKPVGKWKYFTFDGELKKVDDYNP